MGKKIKALQLCAVGFTVEKLLLPLIDEMSKSYDVVTVCSSDGASESLKNKGYRIVNIEIGRKIHPVKNIRTIFELLKFMRKEKFDIVHVHTPLAAILGRIAAKLAGVPIIIYTAHGFYFHDNMNNIIKNIYILMERFGGLLSDYIFTQSTEDYHTALEKGIKAEEKISVIGNGVDIDRFSIEAYSDTGIVKAKRAEFGISEDDIVIGIIGRVVKEKGYIEWTKAAGIVTKERKNIKFIAVGNTLESDRDGVKKELDLYIKDNGLEDKVIFAGSRTDIPEILSIVDIFTLPSYREGMPRSLIEAMCMSKPCIATDIRGCREEVVDGETGFLIPVRDSNSLAEKIFLLVDNPDLRRTMGIKARKRAEKEFNEKIVIKRQMDVLETLVRYKCGNR
ncbi:MAG TPA: glycosyltransferase family 4 protein [Clostridia bacterium]